MIRAGGTFVADTVVAAWS